MPQDVPTDAKVHKPSCVSAVVRRLVSFKDGWAQRLADNGGDASKAGEEVTKFWQSLFKRVRRVQIQYCRSQYLCKQSVHRLVSADERLKHVELEAGAAEYNARGSGVVLEFLAKPMGNTTADELVKVRREDGRVDVYEIFEQTTFAQGRDAFYRQDVKGLAIIGLSPVKSVVIPCSLIEDTVPRHHILTGKRKGELSNAFNLNHIPKDMLDKHTIYGPLNTAAVIEHIVDCTKKCTPITCNPENIENFWRATPARVRRYRALEKMRAFIPAVANAIAANPAALDAPPRPAAASAAVRTAIDVMEGGPGALVVKTPLPPVPFVAGVFAHTPSYLHPLPGTGALLRHVANAYPELGARARDALAVVADVSAAHALKQPLPPESPFYRQAFTRSTAERFARYLFEAYKALRVDALLPALEGVVPKANEDADEDERAAATRAVLERSAGSLATHFGTASFDSQPAPLRVLNDGVGMVADGASVGVGLTQRKKFMLRTESHAYRSTLHPHNATTELGGLHVVAVVGCAAAAAAPPPTTSTNDDASDDYDDGDDGEGAEDAMELDGDGDSEEEEEEEEGEEEEEEEVVEEDEEDEDQAGDDDLSVAVMGVQRAVRLRRDAGRFSELTIGAAAREVGAHALDADTVPSLPAGALALLHATLFAPPDAAYLGALCGAKAHLVAKAAAYLELVRGGGAAPLGTWLDTGGRHSLAAQRLPLSGADARDRFDKSLALMRSAVRAAEKVVACYGQSLRLHHLGKHLNLPDPLPYKVVALGDAVAAAAGEGSAVAAAASAGGGGGGGGAAPAWARLQYTSGTRQGEAYLDNCAAPVSVTGSPVALLRVRAKNRREAAAAEAAALVGTKRTRASRSAPADAPWEATVDSRLYYHLPEPSRDYPGAVMFRRRLTSGHFIANIFPPNCAAVVVTADTIAPALVALNCDAADVRWAEEQVARCGLVGRDEEAGAPATPFEFAVLFGKDEDLPLGMRPMRGSGHSRNKGPLDEHDALDMDYTPAELEHLSIRQLWSLASKRGVVCSEGGRTLKKAELIGRLLSS